MQETDSESRTPTDDDTDISRRGFLASASAAVAGTTAATGAAAAERVGEHSGNPKYWIAHRPHPTNGLYEYQYSIKMNELCNWIQGVGCAGFSVARGLGYLASLEAVVVGCAGSWASCKAHDVIQSMGDCHSEWVHYYQKKSMRVGFVPMINTLPTDLLVPEQCQN